MSIYTAHRRKKTSNALRPYGETTQLCAIFMTHYERVIERQTDKQTDENAVHR